MADKRDYYEVLGLKKGATDEEIKQKADEVCDYYIDYDVEEGYEEEEGD